MSLFRSEMEFLKLRQLSLLQSTMELSHIETAQFKTLFTWSGGPRSSGVSFFCFVSPRAWKQKKLTPLDWGPPLHVNRP